MGKIISLVMNKGGVGKTVTATSLAAILAQQLGPGKVLLVDGDHQGSCSITFGLDPDSFNQTIYEVMLGEVAVEAAIISLPAGLDLLPANDNLVALDFQVFTNLEAYPAPFQLLAKILAGLKNKYEYIIIDSPPALSLMQGNIITASDEILVVFQCEHLSVRGSKRMIETINMFQEEHNPTVKIAGIIPTMLDKRSKHSREVLEEAKSFFGELDIKVLETVIPRSVRFANAPALCGKPAVLAYKANPLVTAYYNLVEEVVRLD